MGELIKNKATITYNGKTFNSCEVVTGIQPKIDVDKKGYTAYDGVIKPLTTGTISSDGKITYILTLVNYGPNPFTNVVVTDVLKGLAPGQYTYTVTPNTVSVVQTSTGTPLNPETTFTLGVGTIPANSIQQIQIDIAIDGNIPLSAIGNPAGSGLIENTAYVQYAENPNDYVDPNDHSKGRIPEPSPTVNAQYNPSTVPSNPISVTKAVTDMNGNPIDSVLCNTNFNYVITIKNNTTSTMTGLVLNDPLPAGFVTSVGNVSVTGALVPGTITLSGSLLTINGMSIAAGATAVVTVTGYVACS